MLLASGRRTGQQDRIESPEINPDQWEEQPFSTNGAGTIVYPQAKQTWTHTIYKIELKWFKVQNVGVKKCMKVLEENISINLCDLKLLHCFQLLHQLHKQPKKKQKTWTPSI